MLYVTTPHRKYKQAGLAVQRPEQSAQVTDGSAFVVSVPAIRFASAHHMSAAWMVPAGEAVVVAVGAAVVVAVGV